MLSHFKQSKGCLTCASLIKRAPVDGIETACTVCGRTRMLQASVTLDLKETSDHSAVSSESAIVSGCSTPR